MPKTIYIRKNSPGNTPTGLRRAPGIAGALGIVEYEKPKGKKETQPYGPRGAAKRNKK